MALITRTYGAATANPVSTGSTILAAHINTDMDTVYAAVNGNLEDANIKSGANIAISKTTLGTYTPWTTWTPTVTAGSGTPTTITKNSARYSQIGKWVTATFDMTITNKGTATGAMILTLPVTASTAAVYCGSMVEYAITAGIAGVIFVRDTNRMDCFYGTGGTPFTDTYRWAGSVTYEAA